MICHYRLKKKSLLPKTEETMFDPKNESKRIEKGITLLFVIVKSQNWCFIE